MSTADHRDTIAAIATAVEADGYRASTWSIDDRSRVYVSRTLSRGRKQEMGYIEVTENGARDYYAERMRSSFDRWLAA